MGEEEGEMKVEGRVGSGEVGREGRELEVGRRVVVW